MCLHIRTCILMHHPWATPLHPQWRSPSIQELFEHGYSALAYLKLLLAQLNCCTITHAIQECNIADCFTLESILAITIHEPLTEQGLSTLADFKIMLGKLNSCHIYTCVLSLHHPYLPLCCRHNGNLHPFTEPDLRALANP